MRILALLPHPGMDASPGTCGRPRVKPLLLFYLFIAKAAAECPKPERWENIVLTDKALLINEFPDDSQVTVECANGYVRESGSGTATCKGGTWSEPDLICKKKDCGTPRPQPNMSFNISAGTLFGSEITVICDKGYQLSGSSHKQCYATGWNGRAKCEIVTCNLPGKVANGRSTWDSQEDPKYGEIIHYVCDRGYTLVGKDNIVCMETGEYNSEPPECRGATTEDATKMITPTPTHPAKVTEASTSTDSPAISTPYRDQTLTTRETSTVSPSARGGTHTLTDEGKATTAGETSTSFQGGTHIFTAEGKATTAGETSTSFQGGHGEAVDTNEDNGYLPVIVSVICIVIVVCIITFFLHKFLMRRKGYANATGPI